ncbi:MAG: PAS domain-containing protein, partial [Endomicrobium sp.]|nr:PAS domain-containing protein [Endomicrobium sp.]
MENSLYKAVLDHVPCHVYWVDYNNIYQGCNDVQAKALGLNSTTEIIGKTNYDLHDVSEADMLNEINNNVMATGTVYECEETVFMKGSSKSGTYLSRKTPLFDNNGKVIGLAGVSIDITDRKRAEELELRLEKIEQEKQKELYEIAKGVSHDICSPISALNAVKYMCADNLPEPGKKMFE